MKYKSMHALFGTCFSLFFFAHHVAKTSPVYALIVQTPICFMKKHQECPLKVYYGGYQVDLSGGVATLPVTDFREVFSLVITSYASFKTRAQNTVCYLKRHPKAPCLWYDLTLRKIEARDPSDDDEEDVKEKYVWDIKKRNLKDVPLQLPEHAIVILMDPGLVHDVVDMKIDGYDMENIIYLPAVVFRPDASPDAFKDAFLHSALDLTLDTIHKKERPCRAHGTQTSGTCFCET